MDTVHCTVSSQLDEIKPPYIFAKADIHFRLHNCGIWLSMFNEEQVELDVKFDPTNLTPQVWALLYSRLLMKYPSFWDCISPN